MFYPHDETGYDSRWEDFTLPKLATDEAENLDDLQMLWHEEFDEVPFTPAEEEMLPKDTMLV